MTGESKLKASARSQAPHSGDDGHSATFYQRANLLPAPCHLFSLFRINARKLRDIRPRAESSFTCARQYHRANIRITLDCLKPLAQLCEHLARHSVQLLRMIETNESDVVAQVEGNHEKSDR